MGNIRVAAIQMRAKVSRICQQSFHTQESLVRDLKPLDG